MRCFLCRRSQTGEQAKRPTRVVRLNRLLETACTRCQRREGLRLAIFRGASVAVFR